MSSVRGRVLQSFFYLTKKTHKLISKTILDNFGSIFQFVSKPAIPEQTYYSRHCSTYEVKKLNQVDHSSYIAFGKPLLCQTYLLRQYGSPSLARACLGWHHATPYIWNHPQTRDAKCPLNRGV